MKLYLTIFAYLISNFTFGQANDPESIAIDLKINQVAIVEITEKTGAFRMTAVDKSNKVMGQVRTDETADFLIFQALTQGTYRINVEHVDLTKKCTYKIKTIVIGKRKDQAISLIDQVLDHFEKKDEPGASIAIIDHEQKVYQRNYGLASVEYNVPNDASTRYDLASVSKHFTAYAIALLEEKGRLDFDDDIRKYLPQLPTYKSVVTIRHLIHHTSGIPSDEHALALAGFDHDEAYVTEQMMMNIIENQPDLLFEPGSQWAYSNVGYLLLAKIIESISGDTFSKWMTQNVFAPLGMHATFVRDNVNKVFDHKATSYVRWTDEKVHKLSPINFTSSGACCVRTSVNDMEKWVAHISEGTLGDRAVVDVLSSSMQLNDGSLCEYSLGLFNTMHHQQKRLSHLGLTGGFRTAFAYFPTLKTAFIHLSNSGEWSNYYLARKIYDIYLADKLKVEYKTFEPLTYGSIQDESGSINEQSENLMNTQEALTKFEGRYYNELSNATYNLAVQNDSLFATSIYYDPIYFGAIDSVSFQGEEYFFEKVKFEKYFNDEIIGFNAFDDEGSPPIYFEKISGPKKWSGSNLSATQIKKESNELDSILEALNQRNLYPGFGISMFDENQIFFQKGYGFADKKNQKPYTEHTTQIIASITKTVTGVAIMQLAEQGKLSLDDPINKYLPFEINNPNFPDDEITIRHLSTHTGSIDDPVNFKRGYLFKKPLDAAQWPSAWHKLLPYYDGNEKMTMATFLQKICHPEGEWYDADMYLDEPIGTSQEYSNLGVTLLGYIVELISEKDYRDYCTQYILQPLGMNESSFYLDRMDSANKARVYLENGVETSDYEIITAPDGGLYTSVHDLTKFCQDIIAGLNGKGKLLKSPLSYERMTEPQNKTIDIGYGITWDLEFPCCIGHAGNDFGAATLMYIDKATGIGRIFFTNISCETDELYDTHMSLFGQTFQYTFGKL